jgi:hypothetical protein
VAVTVLREQSEIDAAQLPAPLTELGDRIEVRVVTYRMVTEKEDGCVRAVFRPGA